MPPAVALTHSLSRYGSSFAGSLALAAAMLFFLPSGATAAPPHAPAPTVASVTAKLDKLADQTETITEQFNDAQRHVQRREKAVYAARRRASVAASIVHLARTKLTGIAVAQCEGGSFSHTGAILSSNSGQGYLDALETQDMIAAHTASVVSRLSVARAGADAARKSAQTLLSGTRGETGRARQETHAGHCQDGEVQGPARHTHGCAAAGIHHPRRARSSPAAYRL